MPGNCKPPVSARKRRINSLSIAKLVKALQGNALTVNELVDETGLHRRTVSDYINALRAEGACYVHQWDPDAKGRLTVPAFMLGDRPDAKRPRKSSSQRAKEYRERRRQVRVMHALAGPIVATARHATTSFQPLT